MVKNLWRALALGVAVLVLATCADAFGPYNNKRDPGNPGYIENGVYPTGVFDTAKFDTSAFGP